jgi:hypothetical protein
VFIDDDLGDRSVGDGDLSLFVLSSLSSSMRNLIVCSCCDVSFISTYVFLLLRLFISVFSKNSRFLLVTLSSSASFYFSVITQNHNERKTKSSPTLVAHSPNEDKTVNEQTTSDQSMIVNEMVSRSMSDDASTLSYHTEQDRVAFFLSSTVILIRAKMR